MLDRLRTLLTLLDPVVRAWENLTERERKLLAALGSVAALLLVLVPFYLLSSSIGDLEDENEQITAALRRIAHARPRLLAQQEERRMAEQRYSRSAPSLGSFLETQAHEHDGLTPSDVQHEPDREEGRFRIRHTRARFQATGLRDAVLFLASIENSIYPIAIERLYVEHHQDGDNYNFQVGVLAFDRGAAPAPSDTGAPGARPPGAAGPPAP